MKKIGFIISFLIVSTTFHLNSQTWNLRLDKDGVKISTRSIEGSNFQEFKGEVTIKSNMSGILKMIDSIPAYTHWMRNCIEAYRIKKINQSSGYSYYAIKAPWPVSDRDACTFYNVKQDTTTKVITVSLKAVPNYIPKKSDRVRIPSLTGFWQLTPVSKGVTKILYQVHCDIGGLVPAAIVNAYIADTPYSNLLTMKTYLESPKTPKIQLDNVKEL